MHGLRDLDSLLDAKFAMKTIYHKETINYELVWYSQESKQRIGYKVQNSGI